MSAKRTNFLCYVICLGIAAVFLMFLSECSPVYPINDWMDTNVYINVAKRMLDGGTLYRDIYDIKGLYFYQLHEIACLISTKSFVGVLLLEILAGGSYLFICFQIIREHFSADKRVTPLLTMALTVVCAFIYFSSGSIRRGDSAEEICLPLIALGIYLVERAMRRKGFLPAPESLLMGLLTGVLFWIKYSLLGAFFGLGLFILVYSVVKKEMRSFARTAAFFLLGLLLASFPVIVYFWRRESLDYMLYYYFIQPLSIYNTDTGIISNSSTRITFLDSQILCIIVILLPFLKKAPFEKSTKLVLLAAVPTTFISSCLLPNFWKYYAIPLYAFVPFGVIVVGTIFIPLNKEIIGGFISETRKVLLFVGIVFLCLVPTFLGIAGVDSALIRILSNTIIKLLIIAIALLLTVLLNTEPKKTIALIAILFVIVIQSFSTYEYSYLAFEKKEDLPQYKFASRINEKENAKLLVLGSPDYGFFWAAGLTPQFQFPEVVNINQEATVQEQLKYVQAGEPDFLVSLQMLCPMDDEFFGYKCIDSYILYNYGNGFMNFFLYERCS